jgi:flagellar protein FliJ
MPSSFRLQSVLKLRLATRDERRKSLADALRADTIVSEQMAKITVEITELRDIFRGAATPGVIEVDRLLTLNRHELLLDANRKSLTSQRKKIAEEIEIRRLALVEADRDVKALEKLRERQERESQMQLDRREQAELDQIALMRGFAARSTS